MATGTLVTLEVIILFFATPLLYFYHRRVYMAGLAISQYVLNALFAFSLLLYPSDDIVLWYVFFVTVFHLCLLVSSSLVLVVTGRVFTDCLISVFGKGTLNLFKLFKF